ncbi:MAG: hypothetical protein JWP85_2082 [Rhodoglobus sp.]|nr:hypothetical protein [Rhodoglobus sp.]
MTMTAENRVPDILAMNGDRARTRRTDRLTSHLAGDTSQIDMTDVEVAVLKIVHENPLSVGTEINQFYSDEQAARGWPFKAWDSPRKRAGELEDAGLLEDAGAHRGVYDSLEREFLITDAGRKTIEMLAVEA